MGRNVGLAEVALQHGRLLGVPLVHLLGTLGLGFGGLHGLPVGKGPRNGKERKFRAIQGLLNPTQLSILDQKIPRNGRRLIFCNAGPNHKKSSRVEFHSNLGLTNQRSYNWSHDCFDSSNSTVEANFILNIFTVLAPDSFKELTRFIKISSNLTQFRPEKRQNNQLQQNTTL